MNRIPPNKNKSKQNNSDLEDKEPTNPTFRSHQVQCPHWAFSNGWFWSLVCPLLGYSARLQGKKKVSSEWRHIFAFISWNGRLLAPRLPFLRKQWDIQKTCLVLWLCGRITLLLPLTPPCPILEDTMWTSSFSTFWECWVVGQRGAGRILVPGLCGVGSLVGPKRQIKTNQKKHCLTLSLKAGPRTASGSPPAECLSLVVASWC